ncbi:MAG: hypothetical protein ABIQ31_02935 [Ferruginibacter sp.]
MKIKKSYVGKGFSTTSTLMTIVKQFNGRETLLLAAALYFTGINL